jgi:head-tail adaptor
MRVPSALLPHLVTVQRFTKSSEDARGNPTGGWMAIGTYKARVLELIEREPEGAIRVDYRVFVRPEADVTADDRLGWGTRTLEIDSVIEKMALSTSAVMKQLECHEVA